MFKNVHGAAATIAFTEPAALAPREFDFSDEDFRTLSKLAYEYAGIVLSDNKRNLVYSRLSRRLRALRLNTFRDYREVLTSDTREIENFINSISTNHTKFFREDHHFEHLRTYVAVPFSHHRTKEASLRIWSAGCSSGEEPYTIGAILKREIRSFAGRDVRILATDIDTEVLTRAARGEYPMSATDDVPKSYLSFFSPMQGEDKKVIVDEEIRSIIAFRRLNLLESWPFRRLFDVIFCRNVMIYFDAETKSKLIDRFTKQLKPGGWLYIGHSESLISPHPELRAVGRTIYRRVE